MIVLLLRDSVWRIKLFNWKAACWRFPKRCEISYVRTYIHNLIFVKQINLCTMNLLKWEYFPFGALIRCTLSALLQISSSGPKSRSALNLYPTACFLFLKCVVMKVNDYFKRICFLLFMKLIFHAVLIIKLQSFVYRYIRSTCFNFFKLFCLFFA